MTRGWLMLAAGEERQHGGNEGYDDDPSKHYSWDSTVPNHRLPARNDVIAIRDAFELLGASVIERIVEGDTQKVRRRCPKCSRTGFKERALTLPRYRCAACKHEFDVPDQETIDVHTYRTVHGAAWVELQGKLNAVALRELCREPESQLSIRELDMAKVLSRMSAIGMLGSMSVVSQFGKFLQGGHKTVVVRSRVGQGRFRAALVQRFGSSCAFTGAHPLAALDAAHLYSYAEHAEHDEFGGLMLRKDIHRLFDMGLLCVNPEDLSVDVHEDLASCHTYAQLHGRVLEIKVPSGTRKWIQDHWAMHRSIESKTSD